MPAGSTEPTPCMESEESLTRHKESTQRATRTPVTDTPVTVPLVHNANRARAPSTSMSGGIMHALALLSLQNAGSAAPLTFTHNIHPELWIPPGATRSPLDTSTPPGATRSHLEPPEATRSHPRPPEATRSHPESPGATRATFNHPEPTSTALKPLVALNDSHHLDPPALWCG